MVFDFRDGTVKGIIDGAFHDLAHPPKKRFPCLGVGGEEHPAAQQAHQHQAGHPAHGPAGGGPFVLPQEFGHLGLEGEGEGVGAVLRGGEAAVQDGPGFLCRLTQAVVGEKRHRIPSSWQSARSFSLARCSSFRAAAQDRPINWPASRVE